MPEAFQIRHEDVVLSFDFFKENRLRFRTFLPEGATLAGKQPDLYAATSPETAIQCTGEDNDEHRGCRMVGSVPGCRLEFVERKETAHPLGKQVVFVHRAPAQPLKIESVYTFIAGCPVARRFVRVTNEGTAEVGIDSLASATMYSMGRLGTGTIEQKMRVHLPRNTWDAEGQWQVFTPSQLGYVETGKTAITISNVGNWSTPGYLPLGMIENVEAGVIWFWQIEHSGSWIWEIGNQDGDLYLYAGGPDEEHHQAWKNLKPGESYQSVPVALGCTRGGFDAAVAALTRYRRTACLSPHPDNAKCHVIFNDYMNCLGANPTTEKELPLIEAAADLGCEYFVIDAGWYAEANEDWWPTVGAWQPSRTRFGEMGLKGLLDHIRSRGLVPGLWVEIESAGVNSPLRTKPDSWFFTRHGRRVVDYQRLLLDFRNPEVRAYADEVIDRLVGSYGAGYLKVDYNVVFEAGTDHATESVGMGLLDHNRAYLEWIEAVRQRHPHVVLENCGSGGCRMDYAMLSRYQVQSSSDQTTYHKYPSIAVGSLAGVLPEQLAVWSYPLADADALQASFNMVNALLCRIHLSGRIDKLKPDAMQQVRNGVQVYKKRIRPLIPQSVPFFPLGMPRIVDPVSPVAIGLRSSERTLFGVWRLDGADTVVIPNPPAGQASVLYPRDLGIGVRRVKAGLRVRFPSPKMAAIIECKP